MFCPKASTKCILDRLSSGYLPHELIIDRALDGRVWIMSVAYMQGHIFVPVPSGMVIRSCVLVVTYFLRYKCYFPLILQGSETLYKPERPGRFVFGGKRYLHLLHNL